MAIHVLHSTGSIPMVHPEKLHSCSWGGMTIHADQSGIFTVPAEAVADLQAHGFVPYEGPVLLTIATAPTMPVTVDIAAAAALPLTVVTAPAEPAPAAPAPAPAPAPPAAAPKPAAAKPPAAPPAA
jgi:hypothetical protein